MLISYVNVGKTLNKVNNYGTSKGWQCMAIIGYHED